MHFKLSKEHIC